MHKNLYKNPLKVSLIFAVVELPIFAEVADEAQDANHCGSMLKHFHAVDGSVTL
jgi:hypothetical protein